MARYAAGERYFVGTHLDQDAVPEGVLDFSGAVLDDADFSKCWFTARFAGASLRATTFMGANVKTCDFSQADLTDANFCEAAMEATAWVGATLLRTRFGEVSLYGAVLREAEFIAMIENGHDRF